MGARDAAETIAGYRLEKLLWQNLGETVYTASRLDDGLPVIAKVYERALYEQAPARFEYEYQALRELDGSALTPALAQVESDERRALIFAQAAGVPLLEGLQCSLQCSLQCPLDLGRWLDVARQAASALQLPG